MSKKYIITCSGGISEADWLDQVNAIKSLRMAEQYLMIRNPITNVVSFQDVQRSLDAEFKIQTGSTAERWERLFFYEEGMIRFVTGIHTEAQKKSPVFNMASLLALNLNAEIQTEDGVHISL